MKGTHLSEHDRAEMRGPMSIAPPPTAREKLTAGIVADLVELPDHDLARVRAMVAGALHRAQSLGTSRKLDGATLAREQAAREAGGFGCHHEPVCETACPVRSFPPIEEADAEPREALITLLDLHDAAGERLRVEHDGDDGRSFVVLGEPDAETAFELGPDAGTRIVGALSDLPAPRRSRLLEQCGCGGKGLGLNGFHYPGGVGCKVSP